MNRCFSQLQKYRNVRPLGPRRSAPSEGVSGRAALENSAKTGFEEVPFPFLVILFNSAVLRLCPGREASIRRFSRPGGSSSSTAAAAALCLPQGLGVLQAVCCFHMAPPPKKKHPGTMHMGVGAGQLCSQSYTRQKTVDWLPVQHRISQTSTRRLWQNLRMSLKSGDGNGSALEKLPIWFRLSGGGFPRGSL